MENMSPYSPDTMHHLKEFFPAQIEVIEADEVKIASEKMQNALTAEHTEIKTGIANQQKTIQTNHTEIKQLFEDQYSLIGHQQKLQTVNLGLVSLVLVLAVVNIILLCINGKKIRKLQKEQKEDFSILQKQVDERCAQLEEANNIRQLDFRNHRDALMQKLNIFEGRMGDFANKVLGQKPPAPPAPVPALEPIQTALPRMLIEVAQRIPTGFGPEVQNLMRNRNYRVDVGYYMRPDSQGRGYEGQVKQVDDPNASFFGVVENGTLYLMPNQGNLRPMVHCAGEFFENYHTATDGINSAVCALLKQGGNTWQIAQRGRIN